MIRLTSLSRSIAVVACSLFAGAAAVHADYTFPEFTALADDDGVLYTLDTSAVPSGNYGSYTVVVDWSMALSPIYAVSDEAEWTLAVPGEPFLHAFSGVSPDGAREGTARTITWTGALLQTYVGGDPLEFTARQNLLSTAANWTNVTITLHSGTVPPAAPPGAFPGWAIAPGTQRAYAWLEEEGIIWIRFNLPAVRSANCESLRFESAASELEAPPRTCLDTCASIYDGQCQDGGDGSVGNSCAFGTDCSDCGVRNDFYRGGNDSELALYTADGFLIAANDDVDQLGPHLGGALVFGVDEGSPVQATGDLAAGTYYLAIAAYDVDFALSDFDAIATTGISGVVALDVSYNTPALDCNSNGTPDVCDIRDVVSADADTNGIPDECPENAGPPPLCANPHGTPDRDGDGLRDFCDPDRDNDGVPNEIDVCPHLPLGDPVQANGAPRFDWDYNCVVTLFNDYQFFTYCLQSSGPGIGWLPLECQERMDADGDIDVDLADFAAMQRVFKSSNP
jgi:hypothetical protein